MGAAAAIRIGVSSVNWWNDLIPLPDSAKPDPDSILAEAKSAGYAGIEMGDPLPTTAAELGPVLKRQGLELVGGFFPSLLLSQPLEEEEQRFSGFLDQIVAMGGSVVFIAEATHNEALLGPTTPNLILPLFPCSIPVMKDAEWQQLFDGVNRLSQMAQQRGLRFGYHPMVATVIEDHMHIEHLLEGCPDVGLVLDTGHLAFAEVDPLDLLDRYAARVVHVHLKNVRPEVVERTHREPISWTWAVINGVFTVPGDGGLPFAPILARLRQAGYSGWIVVEAEQDPSKANPYLYARLARQYLQETLGA